MPSVTDLIFLVPMGLFCCTSLSLRLLQDAGIGWHIRTGQLILATHAIPRVDTFSSTMQGQPWFAWEWLYDVLVGGLESAAGLNGAVLLTAIFLAITFSYVFASLLRRGTNLFVALVLALLAVSASMIHALARPHVISWLLTVIFFSLLDAGESASHGAPSVRPSRWRLWLLPPLMIFWANVHGGFLMGLVLVILYWFAAAWQCWRVRLPDGPQNGLRNGLWLRDLTLVGVASGLASLINPYGWRLHAHIYRYLNDSFLMNHIDEFRSPDFHAPAQKCFAILVLLAFLALAAGKSTGQRLGPSGAAVVLFSLYSGLYASRNVPVAALLVILVIGPTLSDATIHLVKEALPRTSGQSLSFLRRMQSIEFSRRGHLWPVAATALAIWVAFHGGTLSSTTLMNAHFEASRFPVNAVDYLEKSPVSGPIFAPDNWGGYLIYRLYPETKVVLDDRHDLYGDVFLKSYLSLLHGEPDWRDFLRQHPPGCVIVPKNSAVVSLLLDHPNWRQVYADDTAVIFLPAKPPG